MKDTKYYVDKGIDFFKEMSIFEITAYMFALIGLICWKFSSDFKQELILQAQSKSMEEIAGLWLVVSLVFFWACMLVLELIFNLIRDYINDKR